MALVMPYTTDEVRDGNGNVISYRVTQISPSGAPVVTTIPASLVAEASTGVSVVAHAVASAVSAGAFPQALTAPQVKGVVDQIKAKRLR